METRSRKRRDSDAESVASVASISSEPAISRSRSTTPFTLRSQCTRHGSECPEGHGIHFRNRLSPSPKRSSKKSPRNLVFKRNGNIRKNLTPIFQVKPYHENGSSHQTPVTKPSTHTSDYSSAEEENPSKRVNPPSTPLPTASPSKSPLQRSAEKTDFTYANSYSYRSEVTPERIIMMPNMTRRSIERSQGDYSSPDFKSMSSRNILNSGPALSGSKSYYAASYGTDYESDTELDANASSYKLKPPPSNSYSSAVFSVASSVCSKLRNAIFSLTWWIYLITCYSLLLDTYILQSRGISKLRSFCRQQTKNMVLLLLLFLLLPLGLSAGGLLYSALHGLNSQMVDKSANTLVNPTTTIDVPNLPPPSLIPQASLLAGNWAEQIDEAEFKAAKEALLTLQQKMASFEERITNLNSQFDSVQGTVMAVAIETKSCREDASPAAIDKLIEAKLASFSVDLSKRMNLQSGNLEMNILHVNEALKELKDLNEWKQQMDVRYKKAESDISILRTHLDEREQLILGKTAVEIEKAFKKWETDSRPALFNELKTKLISEITNQIKVLDAKSGRGLSKEEVERLIHSALGLYDSDKTGLADYALEPAGGVILSTRCTETFSSHRPRLSIWGFSLWSEPNNPRVVIQPGIVPGQCWSFRGFDGYLVVQLSRKIIPTAFTLEHIPRSLAPDGKIDSAPRNFTVYGLSKESDTNGVQLGRYTYDSVGEPLQTFSVELSDPGIFSIVELRIHSNYGNLNYTCLYRFRVHGQVA